MKILYLTPGCFDKGGISRYARFQIRALREIVGAAGLRVLSLLPPREGDFEDPIEVSWHSKGTSHLSRQAEFSFRALREAMLWRPDVIWSGHVHFSPLTNGLAALFRCVRVLNVYGLEVWTNLTPSRARGLEKSEWIVSDCHFTANYLRTAGLRREGPIEVVWDAVDVHRYRPDAPAGDVLRRYGIPSPAERVNVLTLGRMSRDADHKGYRRLLEAFSTAAMADDRVTLVFAGRGDLIPVLAERAKELALEGRVVFTGEVHEDDMPDVYRSASIFSLVSDRAPGRGEGVPVTPIEAAACGLPILVGNQDGSPEACDDGVTGFVVDSTDIAAHSNAILRLARDPAGAARMGALGRQKAERDFSFQAFLRKHQDIVSEITRAGRSSDGRS
jgi:phosphatidylinositol alpha-1,6-mannosyltransferase